MHAGRQDVALLRRVLGDRGHQRLRHPDRRRLRRPARAARLRGAAVRGPRRAAAQVGELHALGRAAAVARAGRATPARTSCTCSSSPRPCRTASPAWAGSSGRARSAAFLESASDIRDDRHGLRAAAADQLARSRPARRRARAGRAGARTPRARPTGPSRPSSPTPGLVEIAKRRPEDAGAPAPDPRASTRRTLHRRGKAILEVVERGREREPIPVEGERPAQPHPEDAVLIALGEALVRARALESKMAYELIAAKADLQRIALAVRDGAPEPDGPHAGGLAPRARRRRAARPAAGPPAPRRSARTGGCRSSTPDPRAGPHNDRGPACAGPRQDCGATRSR